MGRYRTKSLVVDAIQATNGLWMVRKIGATDAELLEVMTHKAFFERFEPVEPVDSRQDGLLCSRCRAELCRTACSGERFVGVAAWEPPETPSKRGR